ncbi:hypothetical protein JVU11DRAFT_2805 [Chiua virens]|nr:hypothetical protein JVU11DRAFT_2805 [Chiua virens]
MLHNCSSESSDSLHTSPAALSDPHHDLVSPFLATDSQSLSYSGPALHTAENQASTPTLSLSQPFHTVLPSPGALSEFSISSDSPFYSSHTELAKRRPLPPSASSCTSDTVPSSPPPYPRSLPSDEPRLMSRDLSRLPSATHATLAPEAPIILPPQPDEQTDHPRATYDTFLCHSPPTNTWIVAETSSSEYTLQPLPQEDVAFYMSSQIPGSQRAVCRFISNTLLQIQLVCQVTLSAVSPLAMMPNWHKSELNLTVRCFE